MTLKFAWPYVEVCHEVIYVIDFVKDRVVQKDKPANVLRQKTKLKHCNYVNLHGQD